MLTLTQKLCVSHPELMRAGIHILMQDLDIRIEKLAAPAIISQHRLSNPGAGMTFRTMHSII